MAGGHFEALEASQHVIGLDRAVNSPHWTSIEEIYFELKSISRCRGYCMYFIINFSFWQAPGGGGGGGGGGGYSSSSRAGRLGRTLWPQNCTSVAGGGDWKRGSKFYNDPPTLEKGGQYSTSVWKVCKKGGQKSTILKNIGVKILQVWKWGSKFYMLKNRGQNSTMLEKRGVNILHPTPKVEVKILHRLKKGGQKGRAYPYPKI